MRLYRVIRMDAIGIKQNIYDMMGVERMYYLDEISNFLVVGQFEL